MSRTKADRRKRPAEAGRERTGPDAAGGGQKARGRTADPPSHPFVTRPTPETRKKPLPLNLSKILDAIDAKGLNRSQVERLAGWWPNRIHDWEYKTGVLSAEDAWKASEAIGIPFAYIVDDRIPPASPPPSRSEYESDVFVERARMIGLTPEEAFEGLKLVNLVKILELDRDFDLVRQYLLELRDERRDEGLGSPPRAVPNSLGQVGRHRPGKPGRKAEGGGNEV